MSAVEELPADAPVVAEMRVWPHMYAQLQRPEIDLTVTPRGWDVGELLHLREWEPDRREYTGTDSVMVITRIRAQLLYGCTFHVVSLARRVEELR